MDDQTAEGWYLDPFGIHEQRWMSGGRPTALVRDDGAEGSDEPPDRPLPNPLVRAPVAASALGADLRRADDVDTGPSPDLGSYSDVAMDAHTFLNNPIAGGVISSGPRGGMMFETPFERKLKQQARRERWAGLWHKFFGGSRSNQ